MCLKLDAGITGGGLGGWASSRAGDVSYMEEDKIYYGTYAIPSSNGGATDADSLAKPNTSSEPS